MKFGLSEFIEEKIEMNIDQFVSKLGNYVTTKFQIFPDKPLTGKINGNRFDFKINPPSMWSDPFKSRAQGQIIRINGLNQIQFKISPNLTIKLFLGIWLILILSFLIQTGYTDFYETIKAVSVALLFTSLLFVLIKIKVKWDTRRLRNLLNVIKQNYSEQKNFPLSQV
jgi:hypothetical protein